MKKQEIIIKLGKGIESERKMNGYTQSELAELAGLNLNYVGRIERGEQAVTIISLYKICKAFGLSVGEFLQQHNI